MISRVPAHFEFREPWFGCEGALEEQLRRELSPQHPLYGIVAHAVARRGDNDDVLFELFGDGAPAEFALVHLTWQSGPDPLPEYPSTALFTTFDEWVEDGMTPDADTLESRREQQQARSMLPPGAAPSPAGAAPAPPAPPASAKERWAYEFACHRSLEEMLAILSKDGRWPWEIRDSAFYGDYLSTCMAGARVRIHEDSQSKGAAGKPDVFSALLEIKEAGLWKREVVDRMFRDLLAQMGATEGAAIAWYD